MVGTGKGAENGVLFRNAEALERLGSVQVVVLDKTGTLTEGKPRVTDIVRADGAPAEADLLALSPPRSAAPSTRSPTRSCARRRRPAAWCSRPPPNSRPSPVAGWLRSSTGARSSSAAGRSSRHRRHRRVPRCPTPRTRSRRTARRRCSTWPLDGAPGRRHRRRGYAQGGLGRGGRGAAPPRARGRDAHRRQPADRRGDRPDGWASTTCVADVRPDGKAAAIKALQADGTGRRDGRRRRSTTRRRSRPRTSGIAMGTGTDVAMESAGVTLMSGDLRGARDRHRAVAGDDAQHPPEPVLGVRLQRRSSSRSPWASCTRSRDAPRPDLRRRGDGGLVGDRGLERAAPPRIPSAQTRRLTIARQSAELRGT